MKINGKIRRSDTEVWYDVEAGAHGPRWMSLMGGRWIYNPGTGLPNYTRRPGTGGWYIGEDWGGPLQGLVFPSRVSLHAAVLITR